MKVLYPKGAGVATSGTYFQGQHIYNPHSPAQKLHEIVSLTVIGPDILEADRYATAAFAMGRKGIIFIGLEWPGALWNPQAHLTIMDITAIACLSYTKVLNRHV